MVIESPEIEKYYYFLFVYLAETEERRMTHFQETLINRPYGTERVFLLFSRHFVPGRLRRLRRARQPGVLRDHPLRSRRRLCGVGLLSFGPFLLRPAGYGGQAGTGYTLLVVGFSLS